MIECWYLFFDLLLYVSEISVFVGFDLLVFNCYVVISVCKHEIQVKKFEREEML